MHPFCFTISHSLPGWIRISFVKKPANQRSSVIYVLEAVVWIVATFLIRNQVDAIAGRWQIQEPWVLLLKFAVVLALIALAVALHRLLFRWLARAGLIPNDSDREE